MWLIGRSVRVARPQAGARACGVGQDCPGRADARQVPDAVLARAGFAFGVLPDRAAKAGGAEAAGEVRRPGSISARLRSRVP